MARLYIVMATYNGEKYLPQMLDSLVAQTRPADKIIVVDDGSQDQTVNILEEYKKQLPIEIHKLSKNRGHLHAFSKGLEIAKSEVSDDDYIVLADQDDVWLPEKHCILIHAIESSEADLVLGDAQVIDGNGNLAANSWRKLNHIPDNLSLKAMMTGFTNVTGCMVIFKADLLDTILPVPADVPVHDQWIAFCAAVRNGCVSINTPVIQYRIHTQNAIGLGHTHTWSGNIKLNLQWAQALRHSKIFNQLPSESQAFLNQFINYCETRQHKLFLPTCLFWIIKNASSLYPHVHSKIAMIPRIIFGTVGVPLAKKITGRN